MARERAERDVIEIPSFNDLFSFERRIYRLGGERGRGVQLNPSGVPVRGIAYFAVLLAGALVLSAIPIIGGAAGVVPWPVRLVIGPGLLTWLLTIARPQGLPVHRFALAMYRFWRQPRRVAGGQPAMASGERWCPPRLLMLPDGSHPGLRRLRYTGPGVVVLTRAHRQMVWRSGLVSRLLRRPDVTLCEEPGGGERRLALLPGTRLELRDAERAA